MRFRVRNETRGKLLADRAEEARSAYQRLQGLLGRKTFAIGEGLHIAPCNSIHTFFMHFAIDALFLDREGKVVKLLDAMPPWRASGIYFRAHSVLELPAGVAAASGTVEGDVLVFEALPEQQPA